MSESFFMKKKRNLLFAPSVYLIFIIVSLLQSKATTAIGKCYERLLYTYKSLLR